MKKNMLIEGCGALILAVGTIFFIGIPTSTPVPTTTSADPGQILLGISSLLPTFSRTEFVLVDSSDPLNFIATPTAGCSYDVTEQCDFLFSCPDGTSCSSAVTGNDHLTLKQDPATHAWHGTLDSSQSRTDVNFGTSTQESSSVQLDCTDAAECTITKSYTDTQAGVVSTHTQTTTDTLNAIENYALCKPFERTANMAGSFVSYSANTAGNTTQITWALPQSSSGHFTGSVSISSTCQ